MKHLTSTLIKLHMVGVKLWVIEVKEFKFYVHYKKCSLKRSNSLEQKCNQQLTTISWLVASFLGSLFCNLSRIFMTSLQSLLEMLEKYFGQ